MPTDILKDLLEAVKLTPKHLIAISLVLAFLLFGPVDKLQWFGVADVAKDYRQWLGIGFLACNALLAVSVGQWAFVLGRNTIRKRQFKRDMLERLGRLTEDEKQILRFYIAEQTRGNTLRYDDGVVQGLVGSRIIYRSSNMGNLVEGFPFNIHEIAWNALNNDHSLLNGTTDTYRTDKRKSWLG